MKRFFSPALANAVLVFGACLFMSLPAHAATSTDAAIGVLSPNTFDVNHLTLMTANISSSSGLYGCHLYIDGADAGAMSFSSGVVTVNHVFQTPETREAQVRCQDAMGGTILGPLTTMSANAPDQSVVGDLPLGFSAGMLVRLSCAPEEAQNDHCQSVYYVGHDAKRHGFQSAEAYRTWYPNGASVMNVSLAALASLPLGSSISVKPGADAVRFLSQPALSYAAVGACQLRKFASDTVASSALGTDWKTHIDVLTDAFYENFTFGPDVSDAMTLQMTVSTPDQAF